MIISDGNIDDIIIRASTLIREFEGYSARAYQDVRGLWTIGYGFTFWDGQRVTQSYPGVITPQSAEDQLSAILKPLLAQIAGVVKVDLTNAQLSALLSFTYNVGFRNFSGSTMLRLINQDLLSSAAAQFLVWDKCNGKIVPGLLRRRQQEMAVFKGAA